jgi:hypothetical protein
LRGKTVYRFTYIMHEIYKLVVHFAPKLPLDFINPTNGAQYNKPIPKV